MNRLILLLMLAASLHSCQKKDNADPNPLQVAFVVASPAAGRIYHSGDSVIIRATIDYPGELHGYEVKVTDTATGNIVYDEAQHVHSGHFDITDAYVAAGAQPLAALRLEVIAEIDHNGTVAAKDVVFGYVP